MAAQLKRLSSDGKDGMDGTCTETGGADQGQSRESLNAPHVEQSRLENSKRASKEYRPGKCGSEGLQY